MLPDVFLRIELWVSNACFRMDGKMKITFRLGENHTQI